MGTISRPYMTPRMQGTRHSTALEKAWWGREAPLGWVLAPNRAGADSGKESRAGLEALDPSAGQSLKASASSRGGRQCILCLPGPVPKPPAFPQGQSYKCHSSTRPAPWGCPGWPLDSRLSPGIKPLDTSDLPTSSHPQFMSKEDTINQWL